MLLPNSDCAVQPIIVKYIPQALTKPALLLLQTMTVLQLIAVLLCSPRIGREPEEEALLTLSLTAQA